MSGSKKRSGFQITSVTSDVNQTQAGQSIPGKVLSILQSQTSCSPQRSSSQPTTPSLKRKDISHDEPGQGAGSSSRFRVVRLAVSGAGSGGQDGPYFRGRWTCVDFLERQQGVGFRRVMDSMRHAHSLESLEMIGRERGGFHSQDAAHLLSRPVGGVEGAGLTPDSGPLIPSHLKPTDLRLWDEKQPMGEHCLDSAPPLPLPLSRNIPPPLRLDVSTAGRLSPPQDGPYRPSLTPMQTPATLSLDQTIFALQGDDSTAGNRLVTIDNKIEQAMDLVKSHLMLAVREEVELLREQIRELQEKNQQLERENHILRTVTHNIHTT